MILPTLLMSVVAVAAFLLTLSRLIGWRRVFTHATAIDVVYTVGGLLVFGGTLTGGLIAVTSGLLMAIVLSGGRYVMRNRDRRLLTVHETLERRAAEAKRAKYGRYADEYDDAGNWVYDQ